jgi:transcriptional regulator with XRE-family HTH domain
MTGRKAPKVDGNVRKTFAKHVRELLDVRFKDDPNKPKSLSKAAGISLSSVQRALSGDTAPTLDTVEAIASALRVEPHRLIHDRGNDSVEVLSPIKRSATN